ncbi:MAG: polysaccharide pyruvyl transferase family protein [Carboxydocellales bacterium]
MDNILLLDTSVGSLNKGDEIIMKCIRYHLLDLTKNANVFTLPTHISPFHWYQVARGSHRVKFYSDARYKFVCGTNLLTMNMLTHFPQWNINIFNYLPLKGSILFGVGAGKGSKINRYTKMLYNKVLSHSYVHSVRDQRTKEFLEEMGFKAINTGCPTLWLLTDGLCKQIPTQKSDSVIFTLSSANEIVKDQLLIDVLNKNYRNIYFWIQGAEDLTYFQTFNNTKKVKIISPSVEEYEKILNTDVDYVGTRLHAGIYAMRHKKRSIIISIDERARGMSQTFNLNTIESNEINKLEKMIHSEIITKVNVNFDSVQTWISQFTQ